jgi:uncharacterized integral membrane protein
MIFVLLLFVLTGFGLILQDFIPAVDAVYHARILVVPVIFFAGALSVPYPLMLLLAFVTGFMWDALNSIPAAFPDVVAAAVQVGAPPPVSGGSFGITIFFYALLGSLLHGIRPLFRSGRWELPLIMTTAALVLLLVLEFAQINFRRGGFSVPQEVWHHILATAMLSSVLVPLVFLFIYRLARLTGYRIRFDNIYHRRRLPS